MDMSTVIVLAFAIWAAQGAVLNTEDTLLKRVARCDECEHHHAPPGFTPPPNPPPGLPPPPPPMFRTQNWSGFTKSADGAGQGVFSGAAAAADLGPQAAGQAFSLVAAEGNAGAKTGAAGGFGQGSYGRQGPGLQSNGQSGSFTGGGASSDQVHQIGDFSGNGQQQQQPVVDQGASYYGNGQAGFERQAQSNAFSGQVQGQQQQASFNKEKYSGFGFDSYRQGGFSGAGRNAQSEADFSRNQQSQTGGQWQKGGSASGSYGTSGQLGAPQGASRSGFVEGQTALNGALDLASQGLQTANQQPAALVAKAATSSATRRATVVPPLLYPSGDKTFVPGSRRLNMDSDWVDDR